jgi:hypothetical protein
MFGNWSLMHARLRDWITADVFARMFGAVAAEPDMEYAMLDPTIARVHATGRVQKGTQSQAIGRFKDGMTTRSWLSRTRSGTSCAS